MKRIWVEDIGDYDRNPDVYQKVSYDPFGHYGSEIWKDFYFMRERVVRGEVRTYVYESPGRDYVEAYLGLAKALGDGNLKEITRRKYLYHKK